MHTHTQFICICTFFANTHANLCYLKHLYHIKFHDLIRLPTLLRCCCVSLGSPSGGPILVCLDRRATSSWLCNQYKTLPIIKSAITGKHNLPSILCVLFKSLISFLFKGTLQQEGKGRYSLIGGISINS